uniref:Transposase (Putative), gypsy type n=1 Tax=Tanacetum cinerariifolium TaxID=118510 RepID=A0A6L2NZK0_TANCI|nr:transposase (putative), gypsy type [Tanacetum cinerariifolium]
MPNTRVSVSDAILGTQSREFKRLAPVSLPEDLQEILSKISFDASFEHPRRHVPPILCEQPLGDCMILNLLRCLVRMYVRFVPLPFILLTFLFPPYYMSSGPQTAGDVVFPKFDMHVYTSVLTPGEVKNLVAEYAIPSDLHPCVPPSGLTMNRLPVDKICIYDRYLELSGVRVPFSTFLLAVIKHFRVYISQLVPLGLNRLTMFEIYCRSLEINPFVNLFRAFYKLNKQGHWFSFERRSGKGSQDSSMADPPPTGVRDEDIRRLCGHVIDLRPVHPAMLYAVGLTTIWKHVGHHPDFKDGERNIATSMSEFLKFLIAGSVRVGKRTTLANNERVVEYENERVLAAKRKAQAAKDRAAGKRSAAEGTSHPTKKKKGAPMTFALDDSEEDDSNRTGSGTHHSASPLNIIIPDDANPVIGGGDVASDSVRYEEDDADHGLENAEEGTRADSPPATHHSRSQRSHRSEADTHARSTELHHDAGDEQGHQHASGSFGSSFRAEATQPSLFVSAWKPTTHSILNDVKSCRDMMIHLATPAVQAQQSRLNDHQALQRSWFKLGRGELAQIDLLQRQNKLADDHKHLHQEHLSCVGKEVGLVNKLAAVEKEKGDLLDKNREQDEWIKRLEEELASKSSALIKAESSVSELKGDLDNEYKKSLSDIFNQAIAFGWSEGVKVERTQEEAEAILATAVDYDPGCKDTFMSAFDSLFTQSYPYVEKLTESFRLPPEDL